jgi:two-component system nitrogen regulation response regulator GlnG
LTDYYVRRFSQELDKTFHDIPPETREVLRRHSWPGNVRELQSALKQALLQMSGSVLLPEFLPVGVQSPTLPEAIAGSFNWDRFVNDHIEAGSENLYEESLVLMEREVLTRVLQHTSGNQVQAARILGITRGSLRTKMRALKITVGRSICADDDQPD